VTLWLDAQLSPSPATWFRQALQVSAVAVRALQLREATDAVIFQAARNARAVVVTKDADFVRLVEQHGPPPQVVWLTCGNTSNAAREVYSDLRSATNEHQGFAFGEANAPRGNRRTSRPVTLCARVR